MTRGLIPRDFDVGEHALAPLDRALQRDDKDRNVGHVSVPMGTLMRLCGKRSRLPRLWLPLP